MPEPMGIVPDPTDEIVTIQQYLERLKEELAGSDPALVQDALYDAEEYLRSETAAGGGAGADAAHAEEALRQAIQRFGTPREVAEAYHETDARVSVALAQPAAPPPQSPAQRLLGIFLDPRAYGSLLFMFLSLVTGILYFTWAVTGVSLSAGLGILIVGLPFMLLFLASVRLLSLLEGRLVESLLGVRMPRRPQLAASRGGLWERLRSWLADRRTWTTLLYMVLKLPLGIVSFTVFTVLMTLSLSLLAAPVAQQFMDEPLFIFGRYHALWVPWWSFPIFWFAALFDLLLTMHLARAFGRAQGAFAKAMLVRA
jgi:Putative sensor